MELQGINLRDALDFCGKVYLGVSNTCYILRSSINAHVVHFLEYLDISRAPHLVFPSLEYGDFRL